MDLPQGKVGTKRNKKKLPKVVAFKKNDNLCKKIRRPAHPHRWRGSCCFHQPTQESVQKQSSKINEATQQ